MTDTRYALLNPRDVIQEGDEYFVDGGWEIVSGSIGNTKANEWPFRRALPAADTSALGAVVKPLVWEHHPMGLIAAPPTGRAYIIDIRVKNRVFFIKGMEPPPKVDTLDQAKSIAQADYTSRILAAIQPPTPAQIKAAVFAVPEVAEIIRAAKAIFSDDGDYVKQVGDLGFALEAITALEASHDPA